MSAETAENPAQTALEAALDKWSGAQPKTPSTPPLTPAKAVPEAPVTPEPPKPEPAKEPAKEAQAEFKLPSFVTGKEEPAKPPPVVEEELPVEAPKGVTEKEKLNWQRARAKIDRQEAELKELRVKAAEREAKGKEPSETATKRIVELETELNQYKSQFQRASIENHPAFIQQVLRPMQTAYADAQRIISEAGGDPSALDRAIAVSGKAHYEAMDEILSGLPESAKGELTATMRDYSRYAKLRENALKDAPRMAEDLKRQDQERQLQYLTEHKQTLAKQFDEVLKHTRDVFGFELLKKSDNPEHKEWNTMVDNIESYARDLALENQDQVKMLQASILAPAAITLRDLWKKELKQRIALQEELAALRSSEPSMSSSGAPSNGKGILSDIKRPAGEAFTDILKARPWEK